MIRWGINALNHGSSLAVFDNGQLIFNSVDKNCDNPHNLISDAMLKGWEPDHIFWYENPWVKKARQLYAGQYTTAMDMSVLPKHKLKKWGLGYAPITYTSHHASHAAAGYYTSPFNHCAVVVLDAIGEFECATIWNCSHGEMKKVWSRSYPHSLGLFYSAFTQFAGLTPIKDEYLLQKMAEQGNPYLFRRTVGNYFGTGVVDLEYNFHRGVGHWDDNKLGTLQEQCDLAAAVQERFEIEVGKVMRLAKTLTNTDCLVYMGGCAMNSQANRTEVEPNWKYIWSLPSPGDPSSSIGSVLYHTKNRVRDYPWDTVKHIEIKI
jgi:carbamoyltransferase